MESTAQDAGLRNRVIGEVDSSEAVSEANTMLKSLYLERMQRSSSRDQTKTFRFGSTVDVVVKETAGMAMGSHVWAGSKHLTDYIMKTFTPQDMHKVCSKASTKDIGARSGLRLDVHGAEEALWPRHEGGDYREGRDAPPHPREPRAQPDAGGREPGRTRVEVGRQLEPDHGNVRLHRRCRGRVRRTIIQAFAGDDRCPQWLQHSFAARLHRATSERSNLASSTRRPSCIESRGRVRLTHPRLRRRHPTSSPSRPCREPLPPPTSRRRCCRRTWYTSRSGKMPAGSSRRGTSSSST
ncbi:uncharacterized protein ACA1_282360 [Acanthamoeba castellanii str. Neff]|uniref:Uncharacterized protein n=1 Tax=Acanthamoeba castellanii (strain ATCC 30010 / Neff) TaxID=1257118 RepID=L8H9H3_ACACF|nr:uncharacterized protein ACA1_282360 [Acanthamoeba castellanii str. Neff]ELR21071.1 hypothetical protein ACA1_282360 [Acanthamoeba castellanii str. Neff]